MNTKRLTRSVWGFSSSILVAAFLFSFLPAGGLASQDKPEKKSRKAQQQKKQSWSSSGRGAHTGASDPLTVNPTVLCERCD